MDKIFNYIDANKAQFIDNLAKAVEIKSVSAWPECRPEIVKMVSFEFISSYHLIPFEKIILSCLGLISSS